LKKNKISKNWIRRQHRDIYVRSAIIRGYRSRSAFKLIEIDKKFKIFYNKKTFLDLGAFPGSWSQVASEKIKNGKILSVDLKQMDPINNTNFILGNFTETKIKKDISNYFENKIDIIVSDMAQNTTGNKNLDSLITGELCLDALNFAKDIINKNGFFVSKIFMGSNFKEIIDKARNIFKDVKIFKPKSSRKESKENYIICKNLK
tara:strand:+ start:33 stop:644 length:612 start_codon:yes stop_codon:yes gene_type:complete